jgi:Transglutaminase-like superfamily
MSDRQLWDTEIMTETGTFERLVAGPCPPPAGLLLALAAEFRPVRGAGTSFRLDELARGLFEVAAARDPGWSARALATLLTEELGLARDEASVDGLWLDRALSRRAGHPLVLAAIATEVGRRAGVAVGICSTATGWYAAIGSPHRLWLIDPSRDGSPTPSGPVRRHCGHEVAFAALTGLHARLLRDGDGDRAQRAADLRAQLPVAGHQT